MKPTIYIRGGNSKELGVLVLKEHLENKGYRVTRRKDGDAKYDVVVCWGASMRDPLVRKVPALNGNVNLYNKYEALLRFQKAGIPIPKIADYGDDNPPKSGPWFGRKFHHERGKDIQIFKTWGAVEDALPMDFYTLFFKHKAELRAWVYKDRVFAWYQKHYRNPGLDNYKNMEFRSEFLGDFRHPDMDDAAITAVKSLKMDFGAVDILQDDNRFVVLEVNSMPDISSTERISGIRLADIISQWAEKQ